MIINKLGVWKEHLKPVIKTSSPEEWKKLENENFDKVALKGREVLEIFQKFDTPIPEESPLYPLACPKAYLDKRVRELGAQGCEADLTRGISSIEREAKKLEHLGAVLLKDLWEKGTDLKTAETFLLVNYYNGRLDSKDDLPPLPAELTSLILAQLS